MRRGKLIKHTLQRRPTPKNPLPHAANPPAANIPDAITLTVAARKDGVAARKHDGAEQEAAGESLGLHNEALTRKLGGVFAEHFKVARRCTFPVRAHHAAKRLFDIGFLIAGAVIAIPLICLGGLATLLDTGRTVFYVQTRRVRFGRRARIYKMRTLVMGADKKLDRLVSVKHHGKFLNVDKRDCWYTRVGRWGK